MPEHFGIVVRGDEIVGAALLIEEDEELWVAQLAVARIHRGRGLGRALLVHAFGSAWRSGRRQVGLATDGRTGARGLYEHVGMHDADGVGIRQAALMAGAHAKRLLLLALMALAAVNIFTGAPLFAIWVGSRVQGDSGALSMTAVFVVVLVLALVCWALVWALNAMGRSTTPRRAACRSPAVAVDAAVQQPERPLAGRQPAGARQDPRRRRRDRRAGVRDLVLLLRGILDRPLGWARQRWSPTSISGPTPGRTSTASTTAQTWFDRGLVWSYAFNHEEAIRCFERAVEHDPGFALAHWGIAYAIGPNYNKQWEAFDPVDLAASLERACGEVAAARACAERRRAGRAGARRGARQPLPGQ